jgi:uncharacterized membrane protein
MNDANQLTTDGGSSATPHSGTNSAGALPGLIRLTHIIYALHAFSVLTGIFGAASVVGAFLIGWPSIIAVILNYVKREDVGGTFLESHFRWQIRTFWFGLLWATPIFLLLVLSLGFGIILLWIPLLALGVWLTYRVIRGWLALNERRPMYAGASRPV